MTLGELMIFEANLQFMNKNCLHNVSIHLKKDISEKLIFKHKRDLM